MGKYGVLLISLFLLFNISSGQISQSRDWKGESLTAVDENFIYSIDKPNMEAIIAEDEFEDTIKNIAYRFGIPNEVDLSFEKMAESIISNNGSAIKRLSIQGDGAKSINLIFSEFNLPKDGWMHIYSANKKQILGAFTAENRHPDGQFSTSLIYDDHITIEVFYPNRLLESSITLSHIIYGYRDPKNGIESFGDSGPCNINVSCNEGLPWQDQKQSVVMILTANNSRICSGAMINNVREDGSPFMLTAHHCPISTNNVFAFNYESATCFPPTDSLVGHSISGASILARSAKSDFALMKLNTNPPPEFNVYYSGWNNTGEIPESGTSIHHPRGDVKKIALDYKRSVSSGYYVKGDDHWKVTSWDKGTTENASSGAPLYDHNGRIVGQLHGGEASCNNLEGEDYYGKFSLSWNLYDTLTQQLKYWLDPDNTGASLMNGLDANQSPLDFDASLIGFKNLSIIHCNGPTFTPEVLVKNRGTQNLDSIQVDFYLNNVFLQSAKWLNTIGSGNIVTLVGSPFQLNTGYYKIIAKLNILGQIDGDSSNNNINLSFTNVSDPVIFEMIVQTDDYGDEFSWEIKSNTGENLFSKGDYPTIAGGSLHRDTFCLFDACFSLKTFDVANDGLCCDFGNGFYILKNITTGDTIVKNYQFSTTDTSHSFCVGDSCTILARAEVRGVTTPTSSDGQIILHMLTGNPPFTFDWSNGESTQTISNLDTGIYNVLITDSLNCTDSLFYQIGIATGVDDDESTIASDLNIFPNPSDGIFTISGLRPSKKYDIKLFDLSSKLLYQIEDEINNDTFNVDISKFENGMYILKILSEEEQLSYKVIVWK